MQVYLEKSLQPVLPGLITFPQIPQQPGWKFLRISRNYLVLTQNYVNSWAAREGWAFKRWLGLGGVGWPVSTWNPEKSVWPEGKWPTLEAPEPDCTPPPVASSRGLGAIDPGKPVPPPRRETPPQP